MRDLILKMAISIDGFVSDLDGRNRWMFGADQALIVALVALGKGLPMFSELAAPTPLKLMSSKAFPGGAVAQIYRPA